MIRTLLAGACALALSGVAPAQAADVTVAGITVADAHARSANQKTGAAFMAVTNGGAEDRRIVAVRSDAARKVELHTHLMEDGVARMRQIEAIDLPAGETVLLQRGGLHVMFMGLVDGMPDGGTVAFSLVLDDGSEIPVEAGVDNARMPRTGG